MLVSPRSAATAQGRREVRMASGIGPLVSLLDSPPGSNVAEFAVTAIGHVRAGRPPSHSLSPHTAMAGPLRRGSQRATRDGGVCCAHCLILLPSILVLCPRQLAGDESGEAALISGGAIQKLVAMLSPKGAAATAVPLQTAQAVAAVLSVLSYTHRGAEIACDAGAPAALAGVLARCVLGGEAGGGGEGASEEDEAAAIVGRYLTSMAVLGGRPTEAVVGALIQQLRYGGPPAPVAGGKAGGGAGGGAITPPRSVLGVAGGTP